MRRNIDLNDIPEEEYDNNNGESDETELTPVISSPSVPPSPPVLFQEQQQQQQPPSPFGISRFLYSSTEPFHASINRTPLSFPLEPHVEHLPGGYVGSIRTRAPLRNRPHINNERINPPFPWATDRPASFYTLDQLLANDIISIRGDVQCRRCEFRGDLSHDLRSRFDEVSAFITAKFHIMHDRAPPEWLNPTYSKCPQCNQPNSMRPVISERNESINWLFLFLGQALGCCTLDQLRWFCKHTGNHRTGLKNRVLFLSYIDIWEQLKKRAL